MMAQRAASRTPKRFHAAQPGEAECHAFAAKHGIAWGTTRWHLSGRWLKNKDCGVLAAVLRSSTTLAGLDLEDNKITDAGARKLAAAVRENTTLEKLSLGYNHITVAGGALLRDAWGDRDPYWLDTGGNEAEEDNAWLP